MKGPWSEPLARIGKRATEMQRNLQLRWSIRHLHGPRRFETDRHDVIVVALVRDGAYYLDGFFRHHRALGARHFVFIDNGSTDGTVERIREEPGTVVLQSDLPVRLHQNAFRGYAARTFGQDRWVLFTDMDEQFDLPGERSDGLSGLVRHLEDGNATALVAQMLEMFPQDPIRDTVDWPFDTVLERFRYYDTRDITALDYHDPAIKFAWHLKDNTVPDPRIRFLFGGVRRRVFGENCCLTKHPLVYIANTTGPAVHPHCSSGVRCADLTGLIRHYKFANDPFLRDARSLQRKALKHGEDALRHSVASADPDVRLWSPEARELTGPDPLYDDGFLVRPDQPAAGAN